MQTLIVNKTDFQIRFSRKISHIDVFFYKGSELIYQNRFEPTTDKKDIIVELKKVAADYLKEKPHLIKPRKITEKNQDTLTPLSFFVRNGSPNDTYITSETQARCHAHASYYGKKIKTKMLKIEGQPHTKVTIV